MKNPLGPLAAGDRSLLSRRALGATAETGGVQLVTVTRFSARLKFGLVGLGALWVLVGWVAARSTEAER
jgi:hypothetical protein